MVCRKKMVVVVHFITILCKQGKFFFCNICSCINDILCARFRYDFFFFFAPKGMGGCHLFPSAGLERKIIARLFSSNIMEPHQSDH